MEILEMIQSLQRSSMESPRDCWEEVKLDLSNVMDFIYRMAANRLKKRKIALGRTDSQIAGNLDPKIVNRIFNNKRMRNNRFLIPPSYVPVLVDSLELSGDTELFWGDTEDEVYIFNLFVRLVEAIQCSVFGDSVDSVLLDDVRYSKHAWYKLNFDQGDYCVLPKTAHSVGLFINEETQETCDHFYHVTLQAIIRLYKNTRPVKMFTDFFEEKNTDGSNKGFYKLYERLNWFVNNRLFPFLSYQSPNSSTSLGLRVYNLVRADIVTYYEEHTIFENHLNDAEFDGDWKKVFEPLVRADVEYIQKLEQCQLLFDKLLREKNFKSDFVVSFL